jgi:predicted Rossmann fold nucleotide-binding protein DprA/Smf involved in DNA uptake
MNMLDDDSLAALALTSRLVGSAVKPMSSREFRELRRLTDPVNLLGKPASVVATILDLGIDEAERIATLLDRGTGLAIALEKFAHAGVWTIADCGEGYPERLLQRLGDAAPVVLHGVGDISLLALDGVGVVGSQNAGPDGHEAARLIAIAAVHSGRSVVTGASGEVDQTAMNAATTSDGHVIGVLAGSLENAIENPNTRKGITVGAICLVTPYAPSSGFSVVNAMGRSKIVYGLAQGTVVVNSEKTGATWSGATEALKHRYGRVACWTGIGAGPGNSDLIDLGAEPLPNVGHLTQFLGATLPPSLVDDAAGQNGQQLSLGF